MSVAVTTKCSTCGSVLEILADKPRPGTEPARHSAVSVRPEFARHFLGEDPRCWSCKQAEGDVALTHDDGRPVEFALSDRAADELRRAGVVRG